ncbi:MAG TPA: SDR family oxidoreductase [Acidimicrobiales bacterium]
MPTWVATGVGGVFHLASIAGLSALPFGVAYAVAKSAMLGLMRTEALKLGRSGVRVNAVAAGTIRTPAGDAHRSGPADPDRERHAVPLRPRRSRGRGRRASSCCRTSPGGSPASGSGRRCLFGPGRRFSIRATFRVFVADGALRSRLAPGLDSND